MKIKVAILVIALIGILLSGIFAVTTSTLMQSLAVICIGISCILAAFTRTNLRIKDSGLIWVIAVSLVYFLMRSLYSPSIDLATGDLFLLLPCAGLVLIVTYVLINKKYLKSLIWVILSLGACNIICFIPAVGSLRDNLIPFANGDSTSGMFNHRNFCSNLLMMSFLLSISLTYNKFDNILVKILLFFYSIANLYALYCTQARAGYVATILGIVVIIILQVYVKNSKGKNKIYTIIPVVSLLIIMVVAGIQLLESRGTSLTGAAELVGRKSYIAMGVDQIFEEPLFGSGSMSYSHLCYVNWGDYGEFFDDHVWVHNEFIQVLADYGIIGLICLMAYFVMIVKEWGKCFLKQSRDSSDKDLINLRIAGFSIFVGFCVNCLFSFPAHSQPNMIIFTLGCVFMLSGRKIQIPNTKRTWFIVTNPVLALILITIGSMSLFFGAKEIKALYIFSKYSIYVDNANWNPRDHTDDKWQEALEEVNMVSPTYLRLEKLASIYLTKVNQLEDDEKRISLSQKSLRLSEESLIRHPDYPVSIGNKATSLHNLSKYEEADKSWKDLIRRTKSRDIFFRGYNNRARTYFRWAESSAEAGDFAMAKTLCDEAYNVWFQSKYLKSEEGGHVIIGIVTLKMNLLLKKPDTNEIAILINDFYYERASSFDKYRHVSFARPLGQILKKYADVLFYQREPSLALKWYLKANSHYKKASKELLDIENTGLKKEIEGLAQMIEFLKSAGIQPDKSGSK